MSAMGHKRTSDRECGMSALPSKNGHAERRAEYPLSAKNGPRVDEFALTACQARSR